MVGIPVPFLMSALSTYMAPRGGGPPSCMQVPPAEGFRNHRARPLRSFPPAAPVDTRPAGIFLFFASPDSPFTYDVPRSRRFRSSSSLISACCWYWSFGAGFGRSVRAVVSFVQIVVWYWSFGAGFGRAVFAVVSFHLFLWSVPGVGRPSRNLA